MNGCYTQLELAVLDMLLTGEHPVLETLRRQFARSHPTERQFTGVGFYTGIHIFDDSVPSLGRKSFELADVQARFRHSDDQVLFLAFIRDGWLCMLEGAADFGFEGPKHVHSWPAEHGEYSLIRSGEMHDNAKRVFLDSLVPIEGTQSNDRR
jgi:hypothetical protein